MQVTHELANHLVSASFVTALVAFLSGYVSPILSVVLVIMGIIWYTIQIRESATYREWRKDKHDNTKNPL